MRLFFVPFRSADKRFDISYLPSGQRQPYPGTNEQPGSRLPVSLPARRLQISFHLPSAPSPYACVCPYTPARIYNPFSSWVGLPAGPSPCRRAPLILHQQACSFLGSDLGLFHLSFGIKHGASTFEMSASSDAPYWSSEYSALYFLAAVNFVCVCVRFGAEQIIPRE